MLTRREFARRTLPAAALPLMVPLSRSPVPTLTIAGPEQTARIVEAVRRYDAAARHWWDLLFAPDRPFEDDSRNEACGHFHRSAEAVIEAIRPYRAALLNGRLLCDATDLSEGNNHSLEFDLRDLPPAALLIVHAPEVPGLGHAQCDDRKPLPPELREGVSR